jgi:hypothetical protein
MSKYVDGLWGEVRSGDRGDHKAGPYLSINEYGCKASFTSRAECEGIPQRGARVSRFVSGTAFSNCFSYCFGRNVEVTVSTP